MAVRYRLEPETQFIIIEYGGVVSEDDLRLASGTVRSTLEFIDGCPVIADFSNVTEFQVSAEFTRQIAHRGRGDKNLLALIAVKPDVYGFARMYEILADGDERRVRVFARRKDAEEWLLKRALKQKPRQEDAKG